MAAPNCFFFFFKFCYFVCGKKLDFEGSKFKFEDDNKAVKSQILPKTKNS